jgi:uncharacterized protein (TIGR02646 family)
MRAVRRTTVLVPTLAPLGLGGNRARQHEADRHINSFAKLAFPDYWNSPDVRGALYAMHGRTCAYCGCDLPRNDRGDVEHFRPKAQVDDDLEHGGYWWLAYSFENYLLSCRPCNSNRKKNSFPLRARAKRITYESRTLIRREARILLDPALDPVEEWLRVDWENDHCPIRARNSIGAVVRTQVEQTLKFFKINTDPDLVKERMNIRDLVLYAIRDSDFNEARRFAVRYRKHSLVAKQMLINLAPTELPTAEYELRWLINDIFETLRLTLKLLEDDPDDIQRRNIKELLWSLAILWRDPPVGSAADMEDLLTREGVVDSVREVYEQI